MLKSNGKTSVSVLKCNFENSLIKETVKKYVLTGVTFLKALSVFLQNFLIIRNARLYA